jgi:hypothetical protein
MSEKNDGQKNELKWCLKKFKNKVDIYSGKSLKEKCGHQKMHPGGPSIFCAGDALHCLEKKRFGSADTMCLPAAAHQNSHKEDRFKLY